MAKAHSDKPQGLRRQEVGATRDPNDEAEELARQLAYHDYLYWEKQAPEIPDAEYDRLRESLKKVKPDHPQLHALGERTRWKDALHPPIQHAAPMLSIEKSFKVEDVAGWATDAGAFNTDSDDDGAVACFKVDGSSCSLIYKNGELLRAVTRGDGKTGNDITLNARRIKDIPQQLPAHASVEVRGEIYMSLEAFEQAIERQNLDPNKSNPRNLCAGTVLQNDPREVEKANLSFMAHGCVGVPPGSTGKSELQNLLALKEMGFEVPLAKHVRNAAEIEAAIKAVDEKRDGLPYETDGVVFTINRIALQSEAGFTSHHPRFRLAFKFGRQQGETKVTGFIWHTTRTGRVSPTIEVEPVRLGGAIVRLCTMHNAKFVQDMNVAAGDTVLLEREVIPHIVKLAQKGPAAQAQLPARCEVCGAELAWDSNQVNLYCENKGGCPSQIEDYLQYYVTRPVTNMKGVGEMLIHRLHETGMLKTPADLYRLSVEQLSALDRLGEKSARNIIDSIQKNREQTLETFLVSLGIRGLGRAVAGRLVSRFGSLDAILAADEAALLSVENFAETMAATIKKGLNSRRALIDALLKVVELKAPEKVEGHLNGKSFCLTGHVAFEFGGKPYDARPDIEQLIEANGGTIKSVSKALNFLVVGEDPGSKVEKARKAGVTILDAAGLVKMLKNE